MFIAYDSCLYLNKRLSSFIFFALAFRSGGLNGLEELLLLLFVFLYISDTSDRSSQRAKAVDIFEIIDGISEITSAAVS